MGSSPNWDGICFASRNNGSSTLLDSTKIMFTLTHKLLLTSKISAIVIGSLLLLAVVVASIRALVEGKFSFTYVFTEADVTNAEARASNEPWWHRILVSFDQLINVTILRGYPDETISTHAWRASKEGHKWGVYLNGWLDWLQPDHGAQAASGDCYRAQAIAKIEQDALGS